MKRPESEAGLASKGKGEALKSLRVNELGSFRVGATEGYELHTTDYQSLMTVFSFLGSGTPSHSRFLKTNGINRTVTIPTRIQIFERCDLIGG